MKSRLCSLLVLAIALSLYCVPSWGRKKDARERHADGPAYVIEPDMLAIKALQEKRPAAVAALTERHSFINGKHSEGIDVSHYQGTIDWDRVARTDKISYAYLKATEGATYFDDTYTYNLREARRVGLSVGSYHFYRPNVAPEVQLQNLTTYVRPEEQDLVPIIDIEHRGNVSQQQFIDDLRTFITLVERYYGKKPLLYSYQNFYNRHLCGEFTAYHWMIAKYQDERPALSDGKDYMMWQYTASGSIDGIKGNVDRSRIMGSHSLRQVSL